MIKAVIFDMDGLLIDSEPIWEEAEVEVLNKVGVPLTREKTKETMGLRVDEVVSHWHSKYPWVEPSQKEIEKRIVKRVIELILEKGKSQPGVLEIVNLLKNCNIPMAIASSSPTRIIEAALDRIGIKEDIQAVCSAEHESFGKPHPAVYLTTAKKLNLDPKECLVFEDSPNGVLSAKAANMKCIAVPSKKVKGDPRFNLADEIIESLKDFQPSSIMTV